ncbi:hypothetical protein BKA61DRAFT_682828 [Leptodontidium sp. MPI-SDFR-AT-0119]|nr:hypothetical protein BKA61DRAFT_682828 [Leptodontidium sp. MPI-SDFR-AT-0119]
MGNTVSCSFSSAAVAGDTCQSFATEWGSTLANFESLNPGIDCTNALVAGQSYCVVGTVVTPSSTISSASSTSTPTSTSTSIPYLTTTLFSSCTATATVTVTATVTSLGP